jgi:hypothetical protein
MADLSAGATIRVTTTAATMVTATVQASGCISAVVVAVGEADEAAIAVTADIYPDRQIAQTADTAGYEVVGGAKRHPLLRSARDIRD